MISYPINQDWLPIAKKLNKTYVEIWEYKIWKYWWKKYIWDDLPWNICNDKKGCFNWKIISMKTDNINAYIYYDFYDDTYMDKMNIRLYNWSCTNDCLIKYKNTAILPEYLLIDSSWIKLYSENEMLNLWENERMIFKWLKDNKEIIFE